MHAATDLADLSRDDLIGLVVELQRQVQERKQQNEELRRNQKRSATPFSKGKHKPNPKKPGRKPGRGPFRRREEPEASPNSPPVDVPVEETTCPFCGARLEPDGEETASNTDMPPRPEPETRLYRVHICRCQNCKRRFRGKHPDVAADQYGATAHRVYQVRSEHGHEQVMEIIPGDYAGTLVTDRGPSYEAKALQGVEQSKCMSHLLRNVREVVDSKRGPAKRFGKVLKEILTQGHQLWRDYKEGKVTELTGPANEVGERLKKHLRHRRLRDPDNQRLLDGIGLQNDKGRVLRFLAKPEVEATNNRMERKLRPAVIARKVSHCSKTERGAHAHAAFQSILQTAKKVGTSFSKAIVQLTGLQ